MKKNNTQEEITIKLRRFKMEWIEPNKTIIFIGKRKTGKSVLALDYLYHNQDIPFCTCISPTDDLNLTFRPHIPSRFIFDAYSPKLIENFVKRQRTISRKKKSAEKGFGDPKYRNVDARGLLIMDDLLADVSKWKKDTNINWIFMNGRHANITLILTMQYQMGIPPELRVNIDYLFICKETKKTELEKLYKYYASIFPSYDMFRQVLNQATQNYGCLVIDCSSTKNLLEDQVFIYRAQLHDDDPNFKICYEEFWINNDDYIINDEEVDTNVQDNNNINYENIMSKSKFKFNVSPENKNYN